jgi:hypothetical protein
MTKHDALMILENHRITSASKLRAAARKLLEVDFVTYHEDAKRLAARALASERKAMSR